MLRKAILFFLFLSLAASGATLSFTYTRVGGTGVLTGVFAGDLQPDNNTFLVNSVLSTNYNGVPGPALATVVSVDAYFGFTGAQPPVVTIDGSYMDILTCSTVCAGPDEGFVFARNNVFALSYPGYNASAAFGATVEPFGTWQAVVSPEPGSFALVGVLLLAGRRLLHRQSTNQRG